MDGAKPGIWMKAKQVVGESYRQEYYKGEAEDWAKVISTDQTVKVPARMFKNCTKTFEWTPWSRTWRQINIIVRMSVA